MGVEKMSEAEVNGNKISFTNGFRLTLILFNILWACIGAVTAYAYVVVIPTIAENIIANDRKYMSAITENKMVSNRNEVRMMSIKDDLEEIKILLRRTAPYERKE